VVNWAAKVVVKYHIAGCVLVLIEGDFGAAKAVLWNDLEK